MYSGRHNGFSYASVSVDDNQLVRQGLYYLRVLDGYLRNDPLPFGLGEEGSIETNRLRFRSNITLADAVEALRDAAMERKAIWEFHHPRHAAEWRTE